MGFQSIDKNLHRIVPPHFESAHDGHEKRLSLRPASLPLAKMFVQTKTA